MIDLHCHLLPYVDDGAHDLEEAEALLTLEAEQGVKTLCVTPHLRLGMFETPDREIIRQFERLKGLAARNGMALYLSREYHCDELLWESLREGRLLPLGGRTLLTEFSAAHSAQELCQAAQTLRSCGYTPLLAHAERYPVCTEALLRELKRLGALIQINADAVLGFEGRFLKKRVWSLLQNGLADVIASDAHSTDERPPRLRECAALLGKKLGREQAERLLLRNPERVLRGA